jgi:hypothetical protein
MIEFGGPSTGGPALAPAVPAEQLRLAVLSTLSVRTPQARATAGFPCGVDRAALTGESVARMAEGIERVAPAASPAETEVLRGLIWRGIFAFRDLTADARFAGYCQADSADDLKVEQSLIGALAVTPMPFGGAVPLDAIFDRAREMASEASSGAL